MQADYAIMCILQKHTKPKQCKLSATAPSSKTELRLVNNYMHILDSKIALQKLHMLINDSKQHITTGIKHSLILLIELPHCWYWQQLA